MKFGKIFQNRKNKIQKLFKLLESNNLLIPVEEAFYENIREGVKFVFGKASILNSAEQLGLSLFCANHPTN